MWQGRAEGAWVAVILYIRVCMLANCLIAAQPTGQHLTSDRRHVPIDGGAAKRCDARI